MEQATRGTQAKIWTTLPGIIESFDAVKMTATVQPAIQGLTSNADGSPKYINMPLLLDCPVVFPRGGGFTLTFPITAGDECKISFSSRCIDGWWLNGGVQPPLEYRMHDLSDGFVEVGPMSQEHLITDVSTSAAELRTDDGAVKLSILPTGIVIGGTNGNLDVSGNLSAGNGITSSFTTPTGQVVTVQNGIITNIY